MTALKVLDLDNNLLNGAIPTQIASMPVLETLDLSVNSLTRPTATLKNTANTLKILRLNNNSLAGAIPTWVYTLTNLTDLNLASNTSVGGTLTSSINLLTKLVNAYLNNM